MAADDALRFQVNLAGDVVSQLVASGKAASTAEGNVQALTGAIVGLTEASKKKEEGFFTFDLAKGAEMAIGFVEKLVDKVVELGKEIITTAAGAQDLAVAIRLTAGPENVEGIDKLAASFGDTRFDDEEVKKMILPLLEVGVGKDDPSLLQDIATAATDIAARKDAPEAAAAVLDTFQRIHTKREVNAKMLMGVGVNEKDFFGDLGQTLGTSADKAEKMVKAGKVKAETLEAELLAAIAKREGGSLGKATDESAKTLGTTLKRLEHLPENLFRQLADSPGLKLLQERVDHFVDRLTGPDGEKIVGALGGALDKVSEFLLGDDKAADAFIDGIITGVPAAISFMEDLWDVAKSIVGTMKDILQAFRDAGAAIDKYQDNLNGVAARVDLGDGKSVALDDEERQRLVQQGGIGWWESFLGSHRTLNAAVGVAGGGYDFGAQDKWVEEQLRARAAGMQVGQGHAEGIAASAPAVQDAAAKLASCATASVDAALQIKSPSRVMFERGGFTAEGLAMGLEGGAGRVRSAARLALVDSVMSGNDATAGARGGGSVTFAPVYAPVYQLAPGTPEDAVHRANEIGRVAFTRMVDEARARLGVAA